MAIPGGKDNAYDYKVTLPGAPPVTGADGIMHPQIVTITDDDLKSSASWMSNGDKRAEILGIIGGGYYKTAKRWDELEVQQRQ